VAAIVIGIGLLVGVPKAWASSIWKVQTTVNPSSFDDELNAVAEAVNGQTWALGTAEDDSPAI
jgi:hypothetical protein